MKVNIVPMYTAEQFTKDCVPDGVTPTWPSAGSEPPGITPYDREPERRKRAHRLIWDLHASDITHYIEVSGNVTGLCLGSWIINTHDETFVMVDEYFHKLYKVV